MLESTRDILTFPLCFFEIGSHCEALTMASLELTETQLCLPSVEFKCVRHCAWQDTLAQTTIIVLSKTTFSVYLAGAGSRNQPIFTWSCD